ncbi:MAG: hypothetical protein M1837_000053 [Sclerophora amabilis]|nr:MAG: hypothetical protein M1837_000053 [Sclerophora amabilis]
MIAALAPCVRTRPAFAIGRRAASTLQGYPYIYTFPDPKSLGGSHLLSLLPNEPPRPDLAIGTTGKLPPTTESFIENHGFLPIVQEVLSKYAFEDAGIRSQAQAMASMAGSGLGSGGTFFPQERNKRRRGAHGGGGGVGGDGAGGASSQGGAGGGGVGGWIHLSDSRNPPDYGRIANPEDIFGSLQVDGKGDFVGESGSYQSSGTYRIITRDGMATPKGTPTATPTIVGLLDVAGAVDAESPMVDDPEEVDDGVSGEETESVGLLDAAGFFDGCGPDGRELGTPDDEDSGEETGLVDEGDPVEVRATTVGTRMEEGLKPNQGPSLQHPFPSISQQPVLT